MIFLWQKVDFFTHESIGYVLGETVPYENVGFGSADERKFWTQFHWGS